MMFENSSVDDNNLVNMATFAGYVARRISPQEFDRQKGIATKTAVADLQRSNEFKEWHQRCSTCNSSWYLGQFSHQCKECGGFPMIRACAICGGHCGALWKRNVEMSHNMKEGHWDGRCRLTENEQRHFILKNLVDDSEDALAEAMNDLGRT